jgi:hypothetical protein
MRDSFISDIYLNLLKKYDLKRGHKRLNQVKEILKNNNSMKSTLKNSTIYSEKIDPKTTQNFYEDNKVYEIPLKIYKTPSKQILTPIQKIRQKFYRSKKKNEANHSILESFSPLKNKFSLNNILNSYLFKIYLDNSYKKVLYRRLTPFIKKENTLDIKIDVRNLQHKGRFYIPIKKRQREPNKREIGIQSLISFRNLLPNNYYKYNSNSENTPIITENKSINKSKDNNNINNEKNGPRRNSMIQKPKNIIIKNPRYNFNKFNLIKTKFAKNFIQYSLNHKNKKYTKIKKVVSTEKKKIDKILNKLKYDQCNDKDKLKYELVKYDGYNRKKNKKINNNNYNLFL